MSPQIIELYRDKVKSIGDISKMLDIKSSSVNKIVKRAHDAGELTIRPKGFRYQARPDVHAAYREDLVKDYNNGLGSYLTVAKKYGVSESTAFLIVKAARKAG